MNGHDERDASNDPAVVASTSVELLGSGERIPYRALTPVEALDTTFHRAPDGRLLAMGLRGRAVDLGPRDVPADDDDMAQVALDWVAQVRAEDWTPLRGTELDAEEWIDLRTAMVRLGWGPLSAAAAWRRCRRRPYDRALPSAAGWAAAGWVVPAVPDEPEPAFASPVLEARGLLRWGYISRWESPPAVGEPPLPTALDPVDDRGDDRDTDGGAAPLSGTWGDLLSRFRADHYTDVAVAEAEELAVEVLTLAGLGPASALEAEDDPLPERHVPDACGHDSPLVRAAAWFLLRSEADTWVACAYGECQHHWAVEAEEDAYEHAEVLELAAHGVANPVDAALIRRRLLSEAFGDINDVPLAGASDPGDFIAFYNDWVAGGRSPEQFDAAVRVLRGDTPPDEAV